MQMPLFCKWLLIDLLMLVIIHIFATIINNDQIIENLWKLNAKPNIVEFCCRAPHLLDTK